MHEYFHTTVNFIGNVIVNILTLTRGLKMVYRRVAFLSKSSFVMNSLDPMHRAQIQKAFSEISTCLDSHGDYDNDSITLESVKDLGRLFG